MSTVLYVASTASHLHRFHMPYIRALSEEGVRVLTAGAGDGVDIALPFEKRMFSVGNFRLLSRIREVLKKEQVDTVITNTALASFFVRLAILPLRHRPKVLCIAHGYLFTEKGGVKNLLLRTAERVVRRVTDRLLVMNAQDLALAHRYRLSRTEAVLIRGMGFGERSLTPMSREEARAAVGIPTEQRAAIYVGELSARKNQALLIRAVGELKAEGRAITLYLVGDGAAREELEKLAAACEADVRFCGNIEDRALFSAYLQAADLYLSASLIEGLPFNILEAMDAGLPIIASDCKGQTDLLRSTAARLYPCGDLAALTAAMREALAHPSERVGYPNLEDYRLHRVFDENLALLQEACQVAEEGA